MLTSGEKTLLRIQGISFFASSLAGIFVQFYVFAHLNFTGLVLYNFVLFVFLLILYIASGYLLKHFTTKDLIMTSLILTTASYVILLIFKENALNYIVFLGMLSGASTGLFWSGYNLSQYILTHAHSRDHFFGRFQVVMNGSSAIAPLLGGLIVTFFGYYVLFGIVACFNLYLSFIAKNLPEHSEIEFSLNHLVTHVRSKKWKDVLVQNVIIGLYDGGFSVLSGIIFFLVLQDPSVVGFFRSLIFLISALTGMLAGKLIARVPHISILVGIVATISIVVFALYQSPLGIAIFGLLSGISFPILNVQLSSIVLNTSDENSESWKTKYHLFIERDIALGVARIASMFILLILFTHFEKSAVATGWILVISILPLALGLLLNKKTLSLSE